MDFAIACAFVSVIAGSLDAILYKWMVKQGGCALNLLLISSMLAPLFMLAFVDTSLIFSISIETLLLMAVSCAIWCVADWSNVEAYRYMNASVNQMFGALTLVLILFASIFLFGEEMNELNGLGVLLIISSIIYRTRTVKFDWNKGVVIRLLGVLFGAGALIYDKYLTASFHEEVIVFWGFALMTVFYAILGYRRLSNLPMTIKRVKGAILISPLLSLIAYYALITAFRYGELATTYTIEQSCIVVVFLFEVFLLKMRDNLWTRGFASLGCMIGATLICAV